MDERSNGHGREGYWDGGKGRRVRRGLFFLLVGLFVAQSLATWTVSSTVEGGGGTLDERARRGRSLYQGFNCTACHQFYGLGGYMGPDLTNVTRADGKGAAYATGIILHGSQRMPSLGVTPGQAADIVAYLDAFAASGTYPIRDLNLTPYGTYREMGPHENQ